MILRSTLNNTTKTINHFLLNTRPTKKHKIEAIEEPKVEEKKPEEENTENFKILWNDIEIKNKLNIGCTAIVYHAAWNNIEVAVKYIPMEKDIKYFQTERSVFQNLACAQKENPYVVKFHGYVEDDFRRVIVMEYMTNGELNAYLQKHRAEIKEPQMLKFAGEIACGMNFMHINGIIHCDIKSENVLLDKDNNAKLCDFGFSRYKKDIPNENILNGTSICVAPELIIPITPYTPYSEAADVYAYSMVVYETSNLEYPYQSILEDQSLSQDEIDDEILDMALHEKRPVITDKCPPFFAVLTKRCWDQDPKKRPETDEIIRDIKERMKFVL